MKNNILKLGFSLAIFAAISCVALALVYTVTGPVIAGLEEEKLNTSLKEIFPEADEFVQIDNLKSEAANINISGAWQAKKSGKIIGSVVQASGNSYGGEAVMLVGVGIDSKITSARIMTISDTPGLGMNASKETYYVNKATKTTFPGQFSGKAASDSFEVKNDVIAITASTITSRSLTAIVKEASRAGSSWLVANAGGK